MTPACFLACLSLSIDAINYTKQAVALWLRKAEKSISHRRHEHQLEFTAADPGFGEGRFVPSPPLLSPPSTSLPSPPLPLPYPPFLFLSIPRLYPFPLSPPLRSRTPWLRLGGLGERYKLPQRVAAKRFLVHFQPIWAHFGKHFQATCL